VDYAHLKLRQFQHTTTTHFNLPHAYYMKHILKTASVSRAVGFIKEKFNFAAQARLKM